LARHERPDSAILGGMGAILGRKGGPQLATSILLLVSTGAFGLGCGSSNQTPAVTRSLGSSGGSSGTAATGGTTSTGTGGTGGTNTGATGTGGGTITLTGGTTGVGDSGANGMGASDGTGATCGHDDYDGMPVPLDIYVMLDRSSSMLDQVNGSTKWDAVRNALTTFITDPASDGIGIGLQFFPQHDPNVPNSCTTSTECGTNNLCLRNFCQNAGPKIYICDTNNDCVSQGQNLGPCTPLTYCWSSQGTTLCHNDSECTGGRGDCVPFNVCSADTTYSCKVAGAACGTDMGKDLGDCRAVDNFACQHTADCSPAVYAAPAAEIASLPGAAANLQTVLSSTMPDGDTPTAPALSGALSHAKAWATAHPDHKVAVLLATDGLPSDCMANATTADPYDITGVAATAASGLPNIKTFVIGVFAPTDTDSQTNLNQIAKAGGGNNTAYIVNTGSTNVEDQFVSALDMIRGASLPCEFQIPKPSSGSFNSGLVNVVFTNDGKSQTLYYVDNAGSCDAQSGGWYYDDPKTPTQIVACPASCTALKAANNGHVSIQLGCKTVVK
jgi:hypothetical protein